jgi:hypothetical protein
MIVDSKSGDSVPYSEIIDNLVRLANRVPASKLNEHYTRLALNNRILTELIGKISTQDPSNLSRDPSSIRISDSELHMLKRGEIFNLSAIRYSIDFFHWCRAASAEELASQAHQAATDNSLLMAVMALRSILEICGNASLLEKDLQGIPEPKDELLLTLTQWLHEIEGTVDLRLAGTRVNYAFLTKNSLRDAKKNITYIPEEFEADRTAKDLLKGVDLLDKRVKGARAAYEFFSEFTHPNLASAWTHYDRTEIKMQILDVHGYEVHHRRRHVGAAFLDMFGSVLSEGVEIVIECIDELLRISLALEKVAESAGTRAQKVIRGHIRKDTAMFDSRENCPCNQGKNILQCCGKLINRSKFGRLQAGWS